MSAALVAVAIGIQLTGVAIAVRAWLELRPRRD